MKYSNIFQLVSTEFKKAKIPFILIGGFAVNAYKVSRNTGDLDFLLIDEDCSRALEILKNFEFCVDEATDNFARLINASFYPRRVDFVLVTKLTFGKILEKAGKVRIVGCELLVPSVEHLIALKLHALKNNSTRQLKDFPDIISLIRINQIDVNSVEFHDLCLKFGTEEIYNQIKRFGNETGKN